VSDLIVRHKSGWAGDVQRYLVDGQPHTVQMPHTVRVLIGGVDGLAKEVPTVDVLDALRHELVELEGKVLLGSRT
jgi:hypothetical protein